MTSNRAPSLSWSLRSDPQLGYVTTGENETVDIVVPCLVKADPNGETVGVHVRLSRKDARLLAKRLNQCLDRTAKR